MACRQEKSREGVPLEVLKRRAHGRVHSMLRAGLLEKPDRCSHCDAAETFGRDGRSLLQGHHYRGYEHPTVIEWLCVNCHRAETPANPLRGEAAVTAKLTEENVREIRRSPLNEQQLGKLFGVHPTAINHVRSRRTWAHVE